LKKFASQLGSDCSFFLEMKPQMGEGKGEELSDAAVDLKSKFLIIVKPDVHISTQEAYAGIKVKSPKNTVKEVVEKQPLSKWRDHLVNDFEESIFEKFPVISQIKKSLYAKGATYASMSGSGSSVFGIFEKSVDLRSSFPEYTYWSGLL
jgi:4-diphosphocytidyl-2-C-methyl-D-erythritol kinase